MSTKKIHICDICKKEFKEDNEAFRLCLSNGRYELDKWKAIVEPDDALWYHGMMEVELDICKSCMDKKNVNDIFDAITYKLDNCNKEHKKFLLREPLEGETNV